MKGKEKGEIHKLNVGIDQIRILFKPMLPLTSEKF